MIKYFYDLEQGSDEWLSVKLGVISSSTIHNILTPKKLEYSKSDTAKEYTYDLLAQRVYKYIEPTFQTFDMMRGHEDEIVAKEIYSKNYSAVKNCGFITNDELGFVIGYSPDGLVGDEGLVECKSRLQKIQMKLLISGEISDSDILQCQFGLFVSERKWIDHISYSNGLPMLITRILPDLRYQDAIRSACIKCEKQIRLAQETLKDRMTGNLQTGKLRCIETERRTINDGEIK